MVTDLVQTAVAAFDRAEFTERAACPYCGGRVQGYDLRGRKYAVLREPAGDRTITVRVKRFVCRDCGSLCNAEEPFYPDTRLGSLVVDLFLSLSATMPRSRAGRVIEAFGIIVDRTTWRNYAGRKLPDIPATDVFGMRLPLSVISISNIAARTPEGGRIGGGEALAASGFPSAYLETPKVPKRSRADTVSGREHEYTDAGHQPAAPREPGRVA
jgi:uncharacterized Zn-finger protein